MLSFRRSRLLSLLVFTLTFISILWFQSIAPVLSQSSSNNSFSRQEIRGVWLTNIDSDVMFSRAGIERSMAQLAQLNFNTVYPVVWNWGYTTYPSPTMEQAIGRTIDPRRGVLRSRDPLAEIIEQGHKHKLAILPWFEFGFMTNVNSEIIIAHPDWATKRRDGTEVWQEGIWSRRWLNPFRPEVQEFIQNLVLEIVTNYDVDGIQFDDHFGLPYEFGYDDYTVQLYRQEHQGKAPPANPRDPEWVRWRADKITAFMAQIFHAIKAEKADAIVSLSPNRYDFSYSHSLQDWRTWERQGLIEELVLQVYTTNRQSFLTELNRPEVREAKQHIPTAIGILTGLKNRPVPMQKIREQVELVREQQFAGVSFFFFETLWNMADDSIESRQAGFRSMFANALSRPSLVSDRSNNGNRLQQRD